MIGDKAGFGTEVPVDSEGQVRGARGDRWEPPLTADEERELAERILGGDQSARRQLILANLRVVVEVARRFRGGKVPLDDLIQEGNLGLIRASADFDPSIHDCRFYTYAEIWIKAFIHRTLIANDSLIRVPQHVFLQRRQYRRLVNGGEGAADGGSGGAGSASAVPGALEMDDIPHRLNQDGPAGPRRIARSPVNDEGEIVPLTEAIIDDHPPEGELADQERRLLLDLALRRLNPVEAWVLRERYGLCLLIPDERAWSSPGPRDAGRDDPDLHSDSGSPSPGRAFYHRSYLELARDCGLSRHRVQQVEETALQKLKGLLQPSLAQAL